jgi:sporulation protein YlmC with PRC-barrel domain
MDIALKAEVHCVDGAAGHVSGVILNPIEDDVTHLVVKYHDQEYEVPVSHITSADATEVQLNCSIESLKAQPHFTDTEYVRAPLLRRDLTGFDYGVAGYYTPYVEMETYEVKHEHIPLGELEFTRGTDVFAKEGQVGRVDELVVDPDDYSITHIVLREGHLWGQKDVVIGVDQIKHIDVEGVHLDMSKAQIAALPAMPLKRRYGHTAQH